MLANALGDRFLTSPFQRLAFICSFPMALLSLIGVWGVPSQLLKDSVVERRNAPRQVFRSQRTVSPLPPATMLVELDHDIFHRFHLHVYARPNPLPMISECPDYAAVS